MHPGSAAYEERFGLTSRAAAGLAVEAGFIVLVVLFPVPVVVRILVIGVLGWFAIMTMAGVLARRVAFRADAAPITPGRAPLRYAETTRGVPWPGVGAGGVSRRSSPPPGP